MNTTEFGNALEKQVHDYLVSVIEADQFYLSKEHCKFFWKKGYYSEQRKAEIIFDVAIEVWRPGAETFSMLILIECKRYTSRNVPVGDIEQFFQKVQQVASGNSKAILASNAGFDSGTRQFAQSNGIALLRFATPLEVKWELERPPSLGPMRSNKDKEERVNAALSLFDFTHQAMDLYAMHGDLRTNSLWDFTEDLIRSSILADQLRAIENPKGRPRNAVPYIADSELEDRAQLILDGVGYSSGRVSLNDICAIEEKRIGLVVCLNAPPICESYRMAALGKISFSPPSIMVFQQADPNEGRERFTLAHELAHLFLGHSKFIAGEYSDEGDYVLSTPSGLLGPEIARLEYQANVFATCLLMPRKIFVAAFLHNTRLYDIKDKRFGMLFLDDQECNWQNFYLVTSALMREFGVSRAAVTMRLQTLNLLRDVRVKPRSVSSYLHG